MAAVGSESLGTGNDDSEIVEGAASKNKSGSVTHTVSLRERERKIGHRRVDDAGVVTYKKKPTSELMQAIQLGIGQSIGGLSAKAERDVLMQDFLVIEVVFFPSEGSNLTPAHHCSDFRFKTYAPVAFRYFRDLFGIQPEDFMVSLCAEPMTELVNPGASGSVFYISHDDEFIIKTVQHKEAEFLQKLLPGYFLNISQNKRTLLPKFYGLYCYQCGGKNIRFVVMNNLLPSTVKMHEKYDMKGSTYKRKASKHEREKSSPTWKDLDFIDHHPDGLQLDKDTYDALIKTLQRDCRVLESFQIMDYSLLVGVYNLDIANKEKQANPPEQKPSEAPESAEKKVTRASLSRGKSFKGRIGQYSTPMESIQAHSEPLDESLDDEDVPPGGIPARNSKGERLLLFVGIIDILQSFRLKKRLEHAMKSMVIDGDTISVHRPSFYAQRFLNFMATRVFRKSTTALKHSPSKKKSGMRTRTVSQLEDTGGRIGEKSARTISFSDQRQTAGAVGGKPDLVPDTRGLRPSVSPVLNRVAPDRQYQSLSAISTNGTTDRRSEMMTLATYQSDEMMGPTQRSLQRYSPPLSVSESTPTHTDHTEGTPSFTASSPSCSSDVLDALSPQGKLSVFSTTAETAVDDTTQEESSSSSSSKDEVESSLGFHDHLQKSGHTGIAIATDVTLSEQLSFASDTESVSSTLSSVSQSAIERASPEAVGASHRDMENTAPNLAEDKSAAVVSNRASSSEKGVESDSTAKENMMSDDIVRRNTYFVRGDARPLGRISLPGSERLYNNVRLRPHPPGTTRQTASEPVQDKIVTRL